MRASGRVLDEHRPAEPATCARTGDAHEPRGTLTISLPYRLAAAAAAGATCLSLTFPRAAGSTALPRTAGDLAGAPIAHVIEIMLENHTFDDLFGRFPGANGIPVTASFANPLEPGNAASRVLPLSAPPNEGDVQSGLDNSRSAELKMMDRHLGHGYAMDGYTLFPGEGLSSVTTFPAQTDPNEQYLASHFELADRNFQPAIGPTLPNVLYALSGTSHGYLTNAVPGNGAAWSTIFDELSAAGRSSRIYTGVPTSLLHGTVWDRLIPPGNLAGIAPETQFFSDLSGGRLPGFSLLRPGVGYSEEPPEDIGEGDAWLGQIVDAVAHSRYWSSTAIFITYDEGGGFWDHVSPPIVGPDGYGTRTPMVIVSPLARGGVYAKQTTNLSILAFMASLWRLPPLNALEAKQNDLSTAFDFHRRPLPPPSLPVAPSETIGFYGPSTVADVGATGAGQPLTANLQANSRGLSLESKTSARIALTVTPPAGVGVPPHFPSSVELVGGKARLTVTFPVPGYYRILASGPGGILGWLTVDVAVNPDTT